MRLAYADPPYPGQSKKHYKNHPDYAGEVDHSALMHRLVNDFDGFVLHTSSSALRQILPEAPSDARVMAWVKPFAAFKRNVPVAYAWEPVLVRPVRKPVVTKRIVLRDWISECITLKKGLAGAKPAAVVRWACEVSGLTADDELVDLFPGTGAVTDAWRAWQIEYRGWFAEKATDR